MNTKHTKEPWSINDWPQDTTDITIGAVLTPLIAKVPLRDVSINEQKANARRIVACINACEGFSIEELEGANLFDDSIESQSEIIELKKRCDELIAAIQYAAAVFDQYVILHKAKGPKGEKKALNNQHHLKVMLNAIAKIEVEKK